MKEITILLVDDFETFRHLIKTMLRDDAALTIVGESSDGLDAVQKTKLLGPDIVLLDINLPKMNGLAVARKIRQLVPPPKIIFISSESSSESIEQAFRRGAFGYVPKSEVATKLLPLIRAAGDLPAPENKDAVHFAESKHTRVPGVRALSAPRPASSSSNGCPILLNSWKEIANYLGRGVRTAQRWESELALPVRRPRGHSRSAVMAMSDEIDHWLRSTQATGSVPQTNADSPKVQRATAQLRELLCSSHELGDAHRRTLSDLLATMEELLSIARSRKHTSVPQNWMADRASVGLTQD